MSYRTVPRSAWVDTQTASTSTLLRAPNSTHWHRLEERWNEIQVGRQGSYSVERLESLLHYSKTTSRTRAILVCLLTPVPALICLSMLECLPLRPPSEGWSANWMFWVRISLMVFILTFVGISDLLLFVPNIDFTISKRLIVSLGATTGYVGTCLLASAFNFVGFPIPFVWQIGGPLLGICIPGMLVLVLGFAPFRTSSPFRINFVRYLRLVFAFVALTGVYPLCKVVYDLVPEQFRAGALLALPLWKFAAKHFIMWASRELEDFVPMIVALTVDLFSALFVCVCIASSGTLYLSILFIAADVMQALLEFREVRENSLTVLDILTAEKDSTHSPQNQLRNSEKVDLLTRISAVARNPGAFCVVSLKCTRLWACLPHHVTPEQANQLKVLEASAMFGPRGLLSVRRASQLRRKSRQRSMSAKRLKTSSIVPESVRITASFEPKCHGPSKATDLRANHGAKARRLVVQGLQLLFHCEYLALVEYIECVVPLVFATYKVVLHQLPNVVYYPDSEKYVGVAALTNIVVLAVLEVGSLLLLHHFFQRKFDFSPLHQLAFALETQMYLVQANMFLEIVVLLQYELVHLGADFTFRFEWLHSTP